MSQPPSYPPPPPGTFGPPSAPPPGNGLAVAALVLGILTLPLAVVPLISLLALVTALIGIGLGLGGIKRGRRVRRGTAMAGWGLGLSSVGLVIAVLMTFVFIRWLGDALDWVEPPEPSQKVGDTFETDDGDLEITVRSIDCAPSESSSAPDSGDRCAFTFEARNRSDRTIYLDGIRVKAIVDGEWDDPVLEGDTDLEPGASGTVTGSTYVYGGHLDGIAFDADDASSHSAVVVDGDSGQ